MKRRVLPWLACLACVLIIAACATSPTGRSQLQLFSEQQLSEMGKMSHEKMAQEIPVEESPEVNKYVSCVVQAVTSTLPGSLGQRSWKVTVFDQADSVNAFALPGGYIGIYTGLLQVADTPDQLAAVVGHEIAHVTAEHPNARLSAQFATKTGLQLVTF